jgi:hypothetical protein
MEAERLEGVCRLERCEAAESSIYRLRLCFDRFEILPVLHVHAFEVAKSKAITDRTSFRLKPMHGNHLLLISGKRGYLRF